MKLLADRINKIPDSATVGIADKAAKLRQMGHKILDFSAGRAFEPTPTYICKAASNALLSGDTHQTMALGTDEYRQACATKLSRENNLSTDWETEIIATMGVKQALTLALLAIVNCGDEVIVEDPCFVSYLPLIQIAGGKSVTIPLKPKNNFRWTKSQLQNAITERTKAILINSPHNPTGTVHSRADLKLISEIANDNNLFVITDEVYERVTWSGHQHICIASLPEMRDRTITCMGLTKSFSMGGWRIGFVFASPIIIRGMVRLQQHLLTCTNSFVQAGATIAFKNSPHKEVKEMWREWEKRCKMMTEGLDSIPGLHCRMPEGGFYAWVDIAKTGYSSLEFTDKLLNEAQVAVVPGSAFGPSCDSYIRITCVKAREEIEEGLNRIRAVLIDST